MLKPHPARPLFRRSVHIETVPGEAFAELEDDQHHYRVIVKHDGRTVIAVAGEAIRIPWTLCAGAVGVLERLSGLPLTVDTRTIQAHAPPRAQCTHLYDLASIAIVHATRGTDVRWYDAAVDVPVSSEPGRAVLDRDGHRVLDWMVEGTIIRAPLALAGCDLKRMADWPAEMLSDPDDRESVMTLRRVCYVSLSRTVNLDGMVTAADVKPGANACFVYQDGVSERALRVQGATVDFTDGQTLPLRSRRQTD